MGDAVLAGEVEQGGATGGVVQHLGGSLQQDGQENVPGLDELVDQEHEEAGGDEQIDGVHTDEDAPTVQAVGKHSRYQRQRRARAIEEH